MAIQMSTTGANKRMAMTAAEGAIGGAYSPGAIPFITSPGEQLISYLILIGFLLGGLIAAKQIDRTEISRC